MQFEAQKVFVASSGIAAKQFIQRAPLFLEDRSMTDCRHGVIELTRRKREPHDEAPFAAFSTQS